MEKESTTSYEYSLLFLALSQTFSSWHFECALCVFFVFFWCRAEKKIHSSSARSTHINVFPPYVSEPKQKEEERSAEKEKIKKTQKKMKSYFWFMLSNSVLQTSCSRSVGSLQCSSIPLLALCGLFSSLKGNYCYRNIYKKGRNKEINWSWSWFCGVKERKVEKKEYQQIKKFIEIREFSWISVSELSVQQFFSCSFFVKLSCIVILDHNAWNCSLASWPMWKSDWC